MTITEFKQLQGRYLEFFPKSLFAVNFPIYDEECCALKKGGIDRTPLECHFLVDGVVFDDIIPFMCGCVDSKAVAREFYRALASRSWTDEKGEWHSERPIEADGWSERGILNLTMLYLIDHMGYTDHGSSVYSSWLTPKGLAARDILKAYFEYTEVDTAQ